MKSGGWFKWSFAALLALTFAGCATQNINWQARVGTYTYDQAVKDFGPPDKTEKLTDGARIADWLVRENTTVISPGATFLGSSYYHPPTPLYSQTYRPDEYMELTFDANGNLANYRNFSR